MIQKGFAVLLLVLSWSSYILGSECVPALSKLQNDIRDAQKCMIQHFSAQKSLMWYMEEYDYPALIDCRGKYSNFNSNYFKSLPVKRCHLEEMGISLEGMGVKSNESQILLSTLFWGLSFLDFKMIGKDGSHPNLYQGTPFRFKLKTRKRLKLLHPTVRAIYSKKKANSYELGTINANVKSFAKMEVFPNNSLTELVNGNGIGNLIHELGHAYDDSIDADNPFWSENSERWQKIDLEEPVVSKYSLVDVAESFAESLVAYLFDPFLKCYAPKRYEVISEHISLSSDLYPRGIPFIEVNCAHNRAVMAKKFAISRSQKLRELSNKKAF